jgi:hypothetical protein
MNDKPQPVSHIVYVVEMPLSERDFQRFGIDTMLSYGFKVTVLDLGIMTGRSPDQVRHDDVFLKQIDHRIITNKRCWRDEQDTLEEANLIVCAFGGGYFFSNTYVIYRAISSTKTPYLLLMSNYLPVQNDHLMVFTEKIYFFLMKILRVKPIDSIFARLPIWALGLRQADFVVYGGYSSFISRRLIGRDSVPIHAHSMDYDFYLTQNGLPNKSKKQAVYIDQNMGFHADAKTQGGKGVVTPEVYYPALTRFFDCIENEMGLEVVIASHPRAIARERQNLFGNRKVIHGKTSELICKSTLVIAAYSTATTLAVLHDKPILLHTSNELKRNRFLFGFIDNLAERLGLMPVNIDLPHDVNLVSAAAVNAEKRREFIAEFVKIPGSPKKPYWQIVVEFLHGRGVVDILQDPATEQLNQVDGI